MLIRKGWIKFHRCVLDNPVICKDAEYFYLWSYLLLSAAHSEKDVLFSGERITLKPGQLITGRKSISKKLGIAESKVQRILKAFEGEQQIEQQTSTSNRLISIVRWDDYQEGEQQSEQRVNNGFDGFDNVQHQKHQKSGQQNEQQNEQQKKSVGCVIAMSESSSFFESGQQSEQQSEQRVNNERTTSEQRVNTNKNVKNDKNERKEHTRKKEIDDFYESIWLLYPVKKGKAGVSETQKKKLYAIGYDELKRAIERYDSEVKDKQYMKHGSTFFNGGYVDYLDANYQDKNESHIDDPLIRAIGRGLNNV